MERRKYLFKGRVQGVGFRFRCFSIANELKLTGFVKNEYDGSVSMEVQIHYHLLNIKEHEKSFEIRY